MKRKCAGTERRLGMCSSDSRCGVKREDIDGLVSSGLLGNGGGGGQGLG